MYMSVCVFVSLGGMQSDSLYNNYMTCVTKEGVRLKSCESK